jgi:phosphoglycerate dehydrogenase-like enzyme
VVDEAALIRALQARKIMAAGLDVLEEEPTPANNPLLDMDNVLVTPHLAAFAQESYAKSHAFAAQNAARVTRGEEPESVVDYF